MLIVVSGLPGTGKSAVAAELAARLGAVHLSIDPIEDALGTAPSSVDSLPVRPRSRWKDQHRAQAVPGGVPA
jgi:predicted kinase